MYAPEGGFGESMIMQYMILIITQGQQGLGRIRLEFLRILQGFFRCIAASGSGSARWGSCSDWPIVATEVTIRVRTRKPCPSQRKIGVKLHRQLIKIDDFRQCISRVPACLKS